MAVLARTIIIGPTTYPAGTDSSTMSPEAIAAVRNPAAWVGGVAPAMPDGDTRTTINPSDLLNPSRARAALGIGPAAAIGVKDPAFKAKGDGVADDSPAFQAAVDSLGTAGGRILVPRGTYKLATPIVTRSKVEWIGSGRQVSKLICTAGAFTWTGAELNNARFTDLYIRNTSGHMFTSAVGMYLVAFERCFLWSDTPTGSILEQTTAGDYIRVTVDDCDMLRAANSTVPGWNVVNSIAGANCNVWRNLRVDSANSTAAPFFHLESTATGNYCYDNRFTDICGERNAGGIVRVLSARNLLVENVTDYDVAVPYAGDIIKVGKSTATGSLSSTNVFISGCGRRGGTLGAGVYDINLPSNEVSLVTVLNPHNSGISGKIYFNTANSVNVINAPGSSWTGQPANANTSFARQVQFRDGLYIGTAAKTAGTGSPEGVVIGNVGDEYIRTDGGTSATSYVKESGAGTNTGWVALGGPSGFPPAASLSGGRRLLSGFPYPMVVSTTTLAKDSWRYMPLSLTSALNVTYLAVLCTVAPTGGTAAMIFALYNLDVYGRPGTRQADYSTYGSIDLTTGVGGEAVLATTGLTIPAGNWMLGGAWTGTGTGTATLYSTSGAHPGVASNSAAQQTSAYTQAVSGASAPSTASVAGAAAAGIAVFAVLA